MLYSLYLLFWKKYAERQRYFYLYISFVFFVDVLGSVSKVGDYAKIWDNLKRKKALSLTPLS